MRSSKTSLTLVLLVVFLAGSGGASAANLLVNPNFAGSANPWTGAGTFDANPTNSHTADGSGSLVSSLTNSVGTNTSIGAGTHQCVSGVTAGASYSYGGWASLIPPVPGTAGGADIGVQWFSDSACTAFITQTSGTVITTQSTNTNQYTLLSNVQVAPAGTNSALVVASVLNNQAGPSTFNVRFDDMFFQPAAVAQVPALGPSGLLVLALALAAAALWVLRWRARVAPR